ncbi:hypothetical protein [Hungatella hathewayi]|uniref:hypothetical protein n=1 Tax=Hungatella hathewayi TaxID=154046 RepID=UPI0035628514
MELDYATLISPFPLYLKNIGHIVSATLRNIWNPDVTYEKFKFYLSLLTITPQIYYDKSNLVEQEWYDSLTDAEKASTTMIDFIKKIPVLQEYYCEVFNFFLEEEIVWNNHYSAFLSYKGEEIVGVISAEIYDELCDVILQRCNIKRKQTSEKVRFKNKLAQEIWELTHKSVSEKQDKNIELPNIISSVSAKSESLNMINIWELTVYQLYDQFHRLLGNAIYEIAAMRVAAWGDEGSNFDDSSWYQSIYDT